jgi:hypothetical protein
VNGAGMSSSRRGLGPSRFDASRRPRRLCSPLVSRRDLVIGGLVLFALGGWRERGLVQFGEAAIGMHMEMGFMPMDVAGRGRGGEGCSFDSNEMSGEAGVDGLDEIKMVIGDDEVTKDGWIAVEEKEQVII